MNRISAIMLGLSLAGATAAQAVDTAKLAIQEELPVGKVAGDYPPAPGWDKLPEGEFGEKVIRGYNYFINTQALAPEFVGNGLNCVNCHMDAGKKENAAPLWAAYMSYPAFRAKNNKINTYEERIQGCFLFSMNGTPPGHLDPALVDLSAYAYWLAQGTLTGEAFDPADMVIPSDEDLVKGGKRDDFPFMPAYLEAGGSKEPALPGRGYPVIDEPAQAPDIARGKQVYEQECSVCHGANGEGQKVNDRYVFPPLWGPDTYNWGAGMQRVNTAAYFIHQNMPLGQPGKLTEQQAWDVAMYLDTHERPQDPRNQGSLEETVEQFHGGHSQYGKEVNGSVLGTASYPNHPNRPQ
ncbi:cytochrome C [Zobellella taiwanensis]|uniref:Cytochrome C n=1 Tax=Zobellella taiwanensis TaxID=347535 RepID=A0A2P7QWZ9_9GAMM|nr:c-type cytochrome [Zobellella taiwanensis]PSJ42475.1 cytochrome C [Zobellella taiwanensis]